MKQILLSFFYLLIATLGSAQTPCMGSLSMVLVQGNATSAPVKAVPLTAVPFSCTTGTFATIDGNGQDGSAPLAYNWSTGATSQTVSNISPATYTVVVTDANNCTVSGTVQITQIGVASVTIAGNTVIGCVPTSTTLTATSGFNTYAWNNGTTTTSALATSAGGTYTVNVAFANGCTGSATVTVNQDITIPGATTSVRDPSCSTLSDGEIDLTPSGTGAFTYDWSTTATTEDVTGLTMGTYTVTVTGGNGCSTTKTTVITNVYTPNVVPGGVTVPIGGAFPSCYASDNNNGNAFDVTLDNFCTEPLTVPVSMTAPPTGGGGVKYNNGTGNNAVQSNSCGIIFNNPIAYTVECMRSGDLDITVTPLATPAPTGSISRLEAAVYGPFTQACPSVNFATNGALDCETQTNFNTPATLHVGGASAGQIYIVVMDTDGGRGAVQVNALAPTGSALPIKLIYFTGKVDGEANDLAWATATEQNAALFAVERSHDGVSFTEIGRKNAAGNSNSTKLYDYTDDTPPARAYYRLRMIDRDGTYEFSNIIYLEHTKGKAAITNVYPVPTENKVNIEFELAEAVEVNISLVDVLGRQISVEKVEGRLGSNSHTLDLSALPAGVYNVILDADKSKRVTRKVIKS